MSKSFFATVIYALAKLPVWCQSTPLGITIEESGIGATRCRMFECKGCSGEHLKAESALTFDPIFYV